MTNQIKSILKRHAIQRKNDLAPIDELALATGLILKTTNLELCPSYLNKLEQLRQAIIRDFVSTLEPVAWNARRKDWPVGELKPFDINPAWTEVSIPLYDLSEWSK